MVFDAEIGNPVFLKMLFINRLSFEHYPFCKCLANPSPLLPIH